MIFMDSFSKQQHVVTIGMPVYNRPIELERALNAVLSQTYAKIEIVISNNCSPDPRVDELVKKYLKQDDRIKYYFQENPLPVIDNFKFVLSEASGEYFMWLADDDWIDRNYIEESIFFLNNNADYNIVCGECIYHNLDGTQSDKLKMYSITSANASARVIEYYRNVKLNAYYYGLRRTLLSREIPLQNKLGFDWLYLAPVIYRGKVKVLETTSIHITAGGMSNNVAELNKNIGANNFFTRNLIGLSVSANAALDIFKRNIYPAGIFSKFILSIRIFFTVFSRTFMWDVIRIKRFFFGKRK